MLQHFGMTGREFVDLLHHRHRAGQREGHLGQGRKGAGRRWLDRRPGPGLGCRRGRPAVRVLAQGCTRKTSEAAAAIGASRNHRDVIARILPHLQA